MNYKKPKRMFEDSGTVDPKMSYHIELENVANTKRQDIKTMVDLGRYFSIFAPRQSGKTTFFEDFCSGLEKNPGYVAILLSFQDYKNLNSQRFYQYIPSNALILKAFLYKMLYMKGLYLFLPKDCKRYTKNGDP